MIRRCALAWCDTSGGEPELLLVDVGDAGDAVQGEGAVLLAQVVPGCLRNGKDGGPNEHLYGVEGAGGAWQNPSSGLGPP